MPSSVTPRLARLLLGWLLFADLCAAAPAERGYPLIQTYDPPVLEAGTQNFDIARDLRGVLYAANLGGVLVYDGAWWRLIEVGRAKTAFSLTSDAKGRIGVGGIDELGYLAPDASGALRYVSLINLLPREQRHFDQVGQVLPTDEGFLFMTAERLLAWDGTRIETIAKYSGERPYPKAFRIGRESYVWSREGLWRLDSKKLQPVPGGEVFRDRRVDLILPADGGLLVSVRGEGLFLFKEGQAVPFAPEASRWTAEKRLFAGMRLPDGRWVFCSVVGGVLLLRPDGEVDQIIDTAVGLADDFVTGVVTDREGSLWLSLNNGLARVEIASPLSVIDRRAGLQGSIYDVARHHGDLWVATAVGAFTSRGPGERGNGLPIQMHPVSGPPPSAWSLLSVGEDLLIGTAFGIYQVHGTAPPRAISGTEGSTAFALERSKADPKRVWVGFSDGLAAIRREGDGWRYEGSVKGLTTEVRAIVEGSNGVVWCGTQFDGVVGVEVPAAGLGAARLRARGIGGSEAINVFQLRDRIVATRGDQVLRLDEIRARLIKDPLTARLSSHGDFNHLAEDAEGNLWMNTYPPTIRRSTGELHTLVGVSARSIEVLSTEPDGVVWLGSEKGLYRYGGDPRGKEATLSAPLFSRISSGGDRTLFGGASGATPQALELSPDVRRLRIEFAPLSFRRGLLYQTRLEPVDNDWGSSAAEPFTELTRLPPGRYIFHVRTVGPSRETGPEAAWPFRVLPPWYQTPWALGLWLGVGFLGIRGYGGLRSRALRQRTARLEAQVAEQTVELRSTVEELRRAHTELASANARLEELSLQDELTGVANRRRLQQALAEEWSRACRHAQPIAFILLDLDFFKLLNDSRGHREGDLCLQAVARFLSGALQRTGDLPARYGGEEFAVLLPHTDLAGAIQVAEQLREGIEHLAIPHAAAPQGWITASFGVAAMVPVIGQRPEMLIEAADLALYRAKTEGRNRVCAGGVPREDAGRDALAH